MKDNKLWNVNGKKPNLFMLPIIKSHKTNLIHYATKNQLLLDYLGIFKGDHHTSSGGSKNMSLHSTKNPSCLAFSQSGKIKNDQTNTDECITQSLNQSLNK
ncbi:hypothetical protein CIPAW_14G086900 [Carya illinoinensis]|uniref:Uncharacterized protein n=1 Tax=Carya illinoinensis TaxID=32201 RepID=A0A8T1NCF1_CARIL|nr:hypothetical protein CIPAW_16G025900 [Carya illinoinensis]KAG6629466.1 hypothetical protein CIPAW_14G086900 [Carya illinoinensis]